MFGIREVIDKKDKCINVFRVEEEKLFWPYLPPQINSKYANGPIIILKGKNIFINGTYSLFFFGFLILF